MERHLMGGVVGECLKTSVKSSSSEQLINFFSTPEKQLTMTTESFKESSGLLASHNSNFPLFPLSHLTERTNSSSCENFRNHKDLLAPPTSQLAKASSDNPIAGCHEDSLVPPIPPRDYFCKQKATKQSCIHPILKDGQKLSSTHYWLLPEKQALPQKVESETEKSHYINFNQISKNLPSNQPLSKPFFSRPPRHLFGRLACGLQEEDDVVSLLGELEGGGCDNDMLSETSSIGACPNEEEEEKDPKLMSMGEVGETMNKVMVRVEGVTLDECQTVLSMCGWQVEAAVQYLKVENLFRLGLASRPRCKQVLQANNWRIDRAASHLVDNSL